MDGVQKLAAGISARLVLVSGRGWYKDTSISTYVRLRRYVLTVSWQSRLWT